jgi:hypothetical protein
MFGEFSPARKIDFQSREANRQRSGLWQDGLVRPSKAGPPTLSPPAEPCPAGSGPSAGLLFPISPQSDQDPAPLVVVQRKLLAHDLSSLAIGRFDRADIFAAQRYRFLTRAILPVHVVWIVRIGRRI